MEASKATTSFIKVRDRPFSCAPPPLWLVTSGSQRRPLRTPSPPGERTYLAQHRRAAAVGWCGSRRLSFRPYEHRLRCTSCSFSSEEVLTPQLHCIVISFAVAVAIPKRPLSTGRTLCLLVTPPRPPHSPAVRRSGSGFRGPHGQAARRGPSQRPSDVLEPPRGFWRRRGFGILISSAASTAISFRIKKKTRSLSRHLPPPCVTTATATALKPPGRSAGLGGLSVHGCSCPSV